MNLNQFFAVASIPLVVILYVFFWCGLMIAIARLGGWIPLAQKYRATEPFEGGLWHFQKAQFRWSCNYGGILTVGANTTGLYLRTVLLFRPGHPPLFIPWAETKIEMKKSFWLGQYMELQFPQVPRTCIRFPEKLAKKIAGELTTMTA
jgi:hypothetical protein